MSELGEITQLLRLTQAGDKSAESKLIELLYGDLRRLAAAYLSRERRDHTLQPTALLHEAYLRLAGQGTKEWLSRSHFVAAAAQAMRYVLVDWARARSATKRGGRMVRIDLDKAPVFTETWPAQMLDLDAALRQLAQQHERYARVVEMRFFGGLTDQEIAEVLGVSDRTVSRDWEFARAWLEGVLNQPAPLKTRTADEINNE
jgi:RNA polymerase sigma factor (TIGR02999 family)